MSDKLTKSQKWRYERDMRRAWGHSMAHNPKPRKNPPNVITKQGAVMGKVGQSYHPTRAIRTMFADLSDRGKRIAIDLMFGPARKRGSAESIRARPRGLSGTGLCSYLSRPELLARIADLKRFVGVKQYV